jgi:hypothetical protein
MILNKKNMFYSNCIYLLKEKLNESEA